MLSKIVPHARRISYHLGRRIRLGQETFGLRGYFASPVAPQFNNEPEIQILLSRLLSASRGAFIDVGVNTGQTLMKVIGIDRQRRYVGFEPQIGCCYFVNQFLSLNDLTRATILPLALSDSNQILTLYSSSPFDTMASVVGTQDVTGAARPNATYVTARKGDEVLQELQIGEIAAIKIDVEGSELQVMIGLRATLLAKRPPVIFEVLPNFFGHDRTMQPDHVRATNNLSADRIYAFFHDLKYEVHQLNDDGTETPINQFNLDNREGFKGTNYVAYGDAK